MSSQCCEHQTCVKNVPIFRNLKEKEVHKISRLIEQRNFLSQEVIFHEGDPVGRMLILRKGRVKLVRFGEDGSEYLLDILLPGDICGGDQLFSQSKYTETGIALEEVETCTIQAESLKKEIIDNPQMAFDIMEYLNDKMTDYRDTLKIVGTKDALQRIILFLLDRNTRLGSPEIKMTQEEIGNAIYLTKETVNRKLSELQKRGWIDIYGKKKIRILDEFSMRNYES